MYNKPLDLFFALSRSTLCSKSIGYSDRSRGRRKGSLSQNIISEEKIQKKKKKEGGKEQKFYFDNL